ncbi:MAG: L-threonylcarbamoyladenylate synthase [Cyclobacteriaceae bacterium]
MAKIGQDIDYAARLLTKGGLVAIPTETVYGLAANALDTDAVVKIFTAKNRPTFDPLIVHLNSIEKLEQYVEYIPEEANKLANTFWPGPLTLLLKKRETIPDVVTSGLDTVGIRCPNHSLTQDLLAKLPFPLAAPSANPFGYISPTTAQHVNDQLGDQVEYILDGGPCRVGIESTIVGFDDTMPIIYRAGGINQADIEAIVGPVEERLSNNSNPLAPGQLDSHYAPKKKLRISSLKDIRAKSNDRNIGILLFKSSDIDNDTTLVLSPKGDLNEAAANLFSMLRELDQMDVDLILVELAPDQGIGKAINDRLQRAAANG